MDTNIVNSAGVYFEDNGGIFNCRTIYDPDTTETFDKNLEWNRVKESQPRIFWHPDFLEPKRAFPFYYAEITHPTMGTAIFGASRYTHKWQFDTERELRSMLKWAIGEQYKDMIADGYLTIKQGQITTDNK